MGFLRSLRSVEMTYCFPLRERNESHENEKAAETAVFSWVWDGNRDDQNQLPMPLKKSTTAL